MEAEYTIHVSPVTFESLEVSDIIRFDTDRFEAIGEMYNESTGEYQEILWDKIDCWPRDAVCKVVMTNGAVYEGSIDEVMSRLEEDGYRRIFGCPMRRRRTSGRKANTKRLSF